MPIAIPPRMQISEGATSKVSVDLTDDLDDGELIASVAVVELVSSDLTITNLAGGANTATVNTGTLVIRGRTVAIGKAFRFQVSGQDAGSTYTLKYTYTSDSTPPRIEPRVLVLECV